MIGYTKIKKLLLYSLFSILILITASGSLAQGRFDFHFGPSFPLADFASDNMEYERAGGAGIGFTAGFQFLHLLNQNGLGIFYNLDFSYNPLKKV